MRECVDVRVQSSDWVDLDLAVRACALLTCRLAILGKLPRFRDTVSSVSNLGVSRNVPFSFRPILIRNFSREPSQNVQTVFASFSLAFEPIRIWSCS